MANITWKEAPTEAELLAAAKTRKLAELKSAADAEVAPILAEAVEDATTVAEVEAINW